MSGKLSKSVSLLAFKLATLLLLVITLAVGVVTCFALQEILLTVIAFFIVGNVEGSVRQHYSLIALRNIWLLGGGALLLAFVVGSLHHFTQRLEQPRSRRILLRMLVFEILVIAANMVMTG